MNAQLERMVVERQSGEWRHDNDLQARSCGDTREFLGMDTHRGRCDNAFPKRYGGANRAKR